MESHQIVLFMLRKCTRVSVKHTPCKYIPYNHNLGKIYASLYESSEGCICKNSSRVQVLPSGSGWLEIPGVLLVEQRKQKLFEQIDKNKMHAATAQAIRHVTPATPDEFID